MNQTFSTFLVESKNVHLRHLEDLIIDDGIEGGKIALNYLRNVVHLIKGNTESKLNVTVKYDGSPAIVAGIHPENKKFFVGTKAAFSKKDPKIVYTTEDADKHYGDRPELANILKLAISWLPEVITRGVYQGDLMFTHSMLHNKKIDGDSYVTFTPNTITYAIPANSSLASDIKAAKLGIVFHTKYKGTTIQNLSSSFDVSVHNFKRSKNVWVDDVSYRDVSGSVTLTKTQEKQVDLLINAAENVLKKMNKTQLQSLLGSSTIRNWIHQHLNTAIRGGKHIDHPEKHAEQLTAFVHEKIDQKDGNAKQKQKYADLFSQHKNILTQLFTFQQYLNDAKLIVIKKLENGHKMKTFLQQGDSLVVTPQEGFVAVEHLSNNAVKLVDRLNFSQANFARKARETE